MRATTRTPDPSGTNQFPFVQPFRFEPSAPFGTGTLGAIMNTGAVAAPAWSAFGKILSSEAWTQNGPTTPGGHDPLTNPSNMLTGYYWIDGLLEAADLIVLKPYLVLFNSATPTAYAATPAAAAVAATWNIWLVKHANTPKTNRKLEYNCVPACKITVGNSGVAIGTNESVPTSGQYCSTITVAEDLVPGAGTQVYGNGTAGAAELRFDQGGAIAIIAQISGVTASAGGGFERSHV